MNREELIYRIAFASVRGMGVDLAQKILAIMGKEKEFFDMSEKTLKEITRSQSKITNKAYRNQCLLKARREFDFIEKNNIGLHYFTADTYPQRMLQAPDAPILLYSVGQCNFNAGHMVSIVGTRKATQYGQHFCNQLVEDLAQEIPDIVTVSGLAYGTDINAHRASIQHSVPTIAVQACGLNKIYPADHRNDANHIVTHGGCIVSDYTSQDEIHKGNFVARNRIIAAMSDCTVVIESAQKGGALITANIAQSYNRDVFALPGRTGDEYSRGCNHLIKSNQAMLIGSASDLIEAMRWDSNKKKRKPTELELFPQLSQEEEIVVKYIKEHGDIHINMLTEKTGLPVYKVMSTLVELDCRGIILTLPGCRYCMA